MMSDSIVHRWSKRKRLREEAAAEKPEPGSEQQTSAAPEAEGEASEPPEKVELPDLESLGHDSDYSGFLSPEVDAGLRKMALRKLFKAPFFSQLDGLNDYDEDFTTFEALGDIVTSDMKFHEERKKAEAAAKAEAEAQEQAEQPPALAEETSEEQDEQDAATDEQQDEPAALASAVESDEDDQTTAS